MVVFQPCSQLEFQRVGVLALVLLSCCSDNIGVSL